MEDVEVRIIFHRRFHHSATHLLVCFPLSSADLPTCTVVDRLRLVCMGKGILTPDTKSLQECQVPVFKTHPTPVNVSVKPDFSADAKPTKAEKISRAPSSTSPVAAQTAQAEQGCACVIL
jgi:hypothetical protein